MKNMKRAVSLFLILTCLVSALAVVSSGATSGGGNGAQETANVGSTDDVRYTKKVVSVLFDNSGSMKNPDPNRNLYALYSIQMLMSLLSERDALYITPMNGGEYKVDGVSYQKKTVNVDLSNPDRNSVVADVMRTSFLASTPSGGTPSASIANAVEKLTDNGLMDSQNLAAAPENTEHWLIILTDGDFSDISTAVEGVEPHIENYPSLKTIFIGFGPAAPDPFTDLSSLISKYPFTPYKALTSSDVIATMQSVANQLSGRYVLDSHSDQVEVNGSTVNVKFDTLDFSLRSVSVVAQDFGGTLESASYNGADMPLSQACTITPNSNLGMQTGYSAVVKGNPFFSGGTLTLNFSAPVSADYLSIMVEPALVIKAYVERLDGNDWVLTNEQYINANLIEKDKVRIGYYVYEQATGNKIDISTIFGSDIVTSVTYAKKPYKIGQPIELITGNNDIAVEVSVMNGAYKMYSTIRCIIEKNPLDYKVDATAAPTSISFFDKTATMKYFVYSGGTKLDKKAFNDGNFTYTVELTKPDGTTQSLNATQAESGEFTVSVPAAEALYGNYSVKFKVYNEFKISRENDHVLEYKLPTVTLNPSGVDKVSALGGRANVTVEVKADGTALTKAQLDKSGITLSAKAVYPDGSEEELAITSNGTSSTCAVTMNKYGKATVYFNATDGNLINASAEHSVGCYPENFRVEATHPTKLPEKVTTADFTYKCFIGQHQMTRDEINTYMWSLTVKEFDGTEYPLSALIEDDGTITATLDLTTKLFGVYDVCLSIPFADDFVENYEHSVSYYPESLALTTGGGISITEYQLTTNTDKGIEFFMSLDSRPSSFLNKIIKYKVTVDGKDVTEYAVTENDKLVYMPHSDHLGALKPGDKTVTVQIICEEIPALSTSQSVTLTVTPTIYEVKPLEFGNSVVNRFDLKNTDAAVYFSVLRDGVSLSAEELEEALASGAVSVKDKSGTFGWQFWAPVGKSVSVEDANGTPCVAVKVTRDIPVVDSFLAMLIFNGNKNIEVNYSSVSATDAINFKASGAWSYIWRILVILWIIHTIMFTIGFFNGKCKKLPKGTIVTISASGAASKQQKPVPRPVNLTFFERYGWHIVRYFKSLLFFIPNFKYWYHQPAKTISGVTISMSEKGTPEISFSKNNVYSVRYQSVSDSAAPFSGYRAKLKKYTNNIPKKFEEPGVTAGDMQDMFIQNPDAPVLKEKPYPIGNIYGRFVKGKLVLVIFFDKNLSR